MRVTIVLAALGAGCYSPAVDDCAYRCGPAPSLACPSGLTCDLGFCRTMPISSTACAAVGDGGGGDAPNCGFGDFVPTHFAPCAVAKEPANMSWEVSGAVTYNTQTGGSGAPTGALLDQVPPGMQQVRVVRVGVFHVAAGIKLTVEGPVPLIIAADTAIVDGTIEVTAGQNSPSCAVAAGARNGISGCTSGASGGGFGATGGQGGACDQSGLPSVTAASGDGLQQELRGGCAGGSSGGLGGNGGGALQISAATSLRVTGTITAPGRGGNGGGSGAIGGRGGGSGGAIFLEAPMFELTTNGRICANGGAGGEGSSTNAGEPATCDEAARAQGGAGTNGGDGGPGGYRVVGTGGNGGGGPAGDCPDASGSPCGGGGGGGSVGRIRIRSTMPATIGGVVTPAHEP